MTLDELKAYSNEIALDVAMHLYPQGKRIKADWCVGDIDGSPGQSFKINTGIKPGVFKDFANESIKGDNMLELWRQKHGMADIIEAARDFAAWARQPFERTLPGGDVVEDQTASGVPVEQQGNGHRPPKQRKSQRDTRETRPRETVRPPPEPEPEFPEWDGWQACLDAMTEERADNLAKQRGYRPEFVRYLVNLGVLGAHTPANGTPTPAFPVKDAKGKVIACHYRTQNPQWTGEGCTKDDGRPIKRFAWSYEPTGRTPQPLVLGDPTKSSKVWVFESQWDAFAVLDAMHVDEMEEDWSQLFTIFITRGAANGRLISRIAQEGKTLILWPQNDQPHPKTGKIAAEEWVKAIVDEAGQCIVRRVQTPIAHADANDWVRADHPDVATIAAAVTSATSTRESKLPPIRNLGDYREPSSRPIKPPEIIHGLLHRGSKMVIGGTSKGRKSFTLLDLAISVSLGVPWWGFNTTRGRVLYLNFEIQEPFLIERIYTIADGKKVQVPKAGLDSMTLRGMTEPVEKMAEEMIQTILQLEPYALIIFDPIYKLMGGRDENKAGDVTAVLNELERVAVRTGAAVAFGAHYSKGNQAGKESIDRIGGSGAFARDPDSILTMTTHEEEDCFTVEATLRNFAPHVPFVVRWAYPTFQRDSDLDPAALKLPKTGREKRDDGGKSSGVDFGSKLRANDKLPKALKMLEELWADGSSHKPSVAIRLGAHKLECSEEAAKKYLYGCLINGGYLTKFDGTGHLVTTPKADAYFAKLAKSQTEAAENQEPDQNQDVPQDEPGNF